MSQEFNRTESRVLVALSMLDEFLMNPQTRVYSGLVPETTRMSDGENQETSEESSHNDPHPKVGVSLSQSLHEFSPDGTSYRTNCRISDFGVLHNSKANSGIGW